MAHTIVRREFDCVVNGADFFVVSVCGVITETSTNATSLVGKDLQQFKAILKRQKEYKVTERPKEQKWIPTKPYLKPTSQRMQK